MAQEDKFGIVASRVLKDIWNERKLHPEGEGPCPSLEEVLKAITAEYNAVHGTYFQPVFLLKIYRRHPGNIAMRCNWLQRTYHKHGSVPSEFERRSRKAARLAAEVADG